MEICKAMGGGRGWKDRKQGLDRLPIREEEEEEEPRVWR